MKAGRRARRADHRDPSTGMSGPSVGAGLVPARAGALPWPPDPQARPRGRPAALCLAWVLLATAAVAQPPGIEPSERRELAAGESLLDAIDPINEGWVAWAAPSDRHRDLCCWDGDWHHRACSLAAPAGGFNVGERDAAVPLQPGAPYFVVLVERREGESAQLWMVGDACPVRRDGERLTWISGVGPEESLALLEGVVRGSEGQRVQEGALAALALHDLPRATEVLEDLVRTASRRELRGNAAFWLGEAKDEEGYRALDRLLASGLDGELEERIVFALSVSEVPAAHGRLLRLADEAERAETRSQALFWLAQGGAADVEAALWEAAEESVERDVREQAVFAMSQLPGERAVDALLRVLRQTRHPEVRRQALFWLAQNDDPRALDEIERLLSE
jgi:hypothetical protein